MIAYVLFTVAAQGRIHSEDDGFDACLDGFFDEIGVKPIVLTHIELENCGAPGTAAATSLRSVLP